MTERKKDKQGWTEGRKEKRKEGQKEGRKGSVTAYC